jgi:hypothetical protein
MKTYKKYKLLLRIIAGITAIMFLTSCANKEYVEACLEGYTYGFWGGLWHGIIAPIDLVVSLFRDDVTVYAQNNNGAWYAFGFIIGSGGWGILGSKGASSGKRRRRKYD